MYLKLCLATSYYPGTKGMTTPIAENTSSVFTTPVSQAGALDFINKISFKEVKSKSYLFICFAFFYASFCF